MMEIIPLIYMINRKIHLGKNGEAVSFQEFLKRAEGKQKVYILDLDGIEKDKPNLCTYQRMSSFHEIWVDSGPRDLGDVVDATMAGATDITLRKELCPQLTMAEIKEIIENKIYVNLRNNSRLSFENIDGVVNFKSREETEKDYNYRASLKNMGVKSKAYSYESDSRSRSYWEYFNAEGLLVDLNKIKEFENAV